MQSAVLLQPTCHCLPRQLWEVVHEYCTAVLKVPQRVGEVADNRSRHQHSQAGGVQPVGGQRQHRLTGHKLEQRHGIVCLEQQQQQQKQKQGQKQGQRHDGSGGGEGDYESG